MRTPSAPRSNQNRSTSSNSSRTFGLSQLRSGWPGANRCRYHSPAVPSGFLVRVQAGPPKMDDQLFGGSSPCSPRPGRNQNRSRTAAPGPASSASLNHGFASEQWLGTMSTMIRMPSACASWISASASASGAEQRVDLAVVGHVVAGVGHRRGVPRVEPDRVDAQVGQVAEVRADAGQVADAVAVAVGETARVDLVDGGGPPPSGRRLRRPVWLTGSGVTHGDYLLPRSLPAASGHAVTWRAAIGACLDRCRDRRVCSTRATAAVGRCRG